MSNMRKVEQDGNLVIDSETGMVIATCAGDCIVNEEAAMIVCALNCLPGLVDCVKVLRDVMQQDLNESRRDAERSDLLDLKNAFLVSADTLERQLKRLDALIAEAEGGGNG